MNIKPRSLLAAVVALSLAVPGMASADRRGHDSHGYGGDRGGYKHGYNHGYKGGYPGRYYGYRGYPKGNYYYYNNDDHYDDLLLGLAVGGILGYAINGAQYPQYPYGYYPRAQRQAYQAESPAYSDDTCLQEREYQTTVVVGGKNVPAYGTACLQPDGSWQRGPAQTVAY